MELLIVLILAASFFLTYASLPLWIRKAKQIGLMWKDMHKIGNERSVAGSGGTMVVFSFAFGLLLYIALNTFYFSSMTHTISLLGLLVCVLLVSGIGLIDDLFGWQHGGLSKRSRIVLVLFASIPLVVINAGVSSMNFPFLGTIQLGILYPLLMIPLGIVGATTTFNFLAGYNGLESSQGILLLGGLAIVTYLTGNAWLSVVALFGVVTLLGFYIFNFHPARVFPGDALTYFVGALVAGLAILGNIEKIAVIFFIPFMIEFVLKVRGHLIKQSFGKLRHDGSLEAPYTKMYSLTHVAIHTLTRLKPSGKVYERDVVLLLNGFQLLFILLGFCIFLL